VLVGKTCPSFPKSQLQWLKGEPTDVPVPGKPCVIELWATWCGPCRQIFPHLSKIQGEYAAKGLRVVGISVEELGGELQQFVDYQSGKMDYTVACSDRVGGALMQAAGVSGIPHSFVVDSEGVIQFSGHPGNPSFAAAVRKVMTTATAPKALPLVTASREELAAMPVRTLKTILQERNLSVAGLAEKRDLVDRILSDCTTQTYFANV